MRAPPSRLPWAARHLTAGKVLTNFPTQISFKTTSPPQIYTVQSGDTWASITQFLYSTSDPNAITALQNALGTQTLTPGAALNLPATINYVTTANVTVGPYYTVQSGDTWASIAQSLYGTSDPNAAAALQAAEGNPTLSVGVQLMSLPATLTWSSPVTVTVPPYYVVQSGDTWAWIAGELYDSRALGSELQNALGNPTLTAGEHLTNLPSSLSETLTTSSVIPPNYTVGQGATWAGVTAAIYGTSDPLAVAALQAALGNPTLSAGEQLALPSSLTFQPSADAALHPYYTVQPGDTWASITQIIYGSSDPNAAAALQTVLGNPVLTPGEQLVGLPPNLQVAGTPPATGYTLASEVAAPAPYMVQSGDTWASITAALYGTADPNAIAALQAALEADPTLSVGEQLANIPASLSYVPTATVTLQSYVVQPGDTWASIAQVLYGSSNAATALETALGSPTLAAGEVLIVPPAGLVAVAPNYTVQVGDTWASIAEFLYGTTDPNAAVALQAALGNSTLSAGEQLSGIPTVLVYEPTSTVSVQPYYTVQTGDTWASIAQQLYGTSALASELQAALGNPPLAPGAELVALPADLTYPTYVTVAPYYTVQAGDTWASVAQTLFGSNTLASQLEAALGDPPLFAGEHLVNLPPELITASADSEPATPVYTVQPGDTWASIAQLLYGTTAVASQLQEYLGSPVLSPGEQLSYLPGALDYSGQTTVAAQLSYIVQADDTWASITQTLYGTSDASAVLALQAALGYPYLNTGEQLTDLPSVLAYETTAGTAVSLPYRASATLTIAFSYTIQAGDTWSTIVHKLSTATAVWRMAATRCRRRWVIQRSVPARS